MQNDTIEIEIEIAARPATVYRFLSEPDRFREWLGDVTVAPRPDGDLTVKYPNGDVARGKFVELTPNRRVVFTWGYDNSANGMPPGSTTVTVELSEIATGTLLKFRHEGIPNDAARIGHTHGWKHFSTQLAGAAVKLQFAGQLPRLLESYARAFNEPEESARLAALVECWDSGATFCDPMGRGAGTAELSRNIGIAHQTAPGFRLEITGSPQQTAEYVHFDWSIFVGEHLYSTGNSFGKLKLSGQFAEVIGFWNLPK
jgi:uncharacterized protein YndB with AHSA1/START domain